MTTFDCPNCDIEHDINHHPDHLSGMQNNRFSFECDCGAEFDVDVDWEPYLTVLKSTMVMPNGATP